MNFFSKKTIILLFFVGVFSSCRNEITPETKEFTSETKEFTINSTVDLEPKSTTNQVIVHDNYTLSYHEEFEQPEWVAYTLKKDYGKGSNFERPFFEQDEKVKPVRHIGAIIKNPVMTKAIYVRLAT